MSLLDSFITLHNERPLFMFIYMFFVGAILGSFFSFLGYRYSRYVENENSQILSELKGEQHTKVKHSNILEARSSCDICGERIAFYDNIPIFSWLILGGKSRCCKSPIPLRYLVTEFWFSMAFSLPLLLIPFGLPYLSFVFVFLVSYVAADIDNRTKTIPFGLVVTMALGYGVFLSVMSDYLLGDYIRLLALLLSTSMLISISGFSNRLIGNGDIHFIAVCAAILSNNYLYFFYFLAFTCFVFTITTLKIPKTEKDMGFSLHIAFSSVLLLHLLKTYSSI